MFGSNIELPSNRMLSYSSALKKYNSIKPIRGRQDQNTRPLARRSNDSLTIHIEPSSGDILVRLYATDIIRYVHPAGGDPDLSPIILDPYASALTNRVMWSILGPHVNTHWSDAGLITEVGGRCYNTPSYAAIQPAQSGWTLTDGSVPFEVPYLDRKAGKQALRDANYYTFQTWIKTHIRLGTKALLGDTWRSHPFDWTPSNAFSLLTEGETGWAEISRRFSPRAGLDRELGSLREAVYKAELCYDTVTTPYFESYDAMKSAMRRIKNY